MTPKSTRFIAAACLVAPLAVLIIAAGCDSRTALPPPASGPLPKLPLAVYAGSHACAECHRAEFSIQSHSNHALTMRHADRESLGRLSPSVGQIADTAYSVSEKDGRFTFSSSDPTVGGAGIEYALGSGIANLTFIGEVGSDRLTEFRMSLNPVLRKWYITPGHENMPDRGLGFVHEGAMATRCVRCHADATEPGSNKPAEGSLGVGCESCHGPAAAHIAAARNDPHAADLKIINPGKSSPHDINTLCGTCHRSVADITLTGADSVNTPRFQTYALEISSCYRKSGNRISCITCHDPHTNASTDLHHYESVCLSCHTAGTGSGVKICPVNAKDKCIGCHMPKRRVLPATKITLEMTDHLIWAYKPGH